VWRRLAALLLLATAGTVSAAAEELPALWSVQGEEGRVYLFGTIHLMNRNVIWFDGYVEHAFRRAETLVVEVDQTAISRGERVKVLQELALLPQHKQLSGIVSEEHMRELEEIMKPAGVSKEAMQRWRPWYAGITVTAAAARQAGYLPKYGVDITLLRKAKNMGMRIEQLESFREQLELFAGLDREAALYFLTDSIENQEAIRKQFGEMKRNWLEEDLSALEALLLESAEENRSFYRELFLRRNREWLPEIVELLKEPGEHFVAVGSGHLVGEDGLISLLRQQGYTVERE
jgi:hypothetical protein